MRQGTGGSELMADLGLVTQPEPEPGAERKAWGIVMDAIDEALTVPGGIEGEGDRLMLTSVRRHAQFMSDLPPVSLAATEGRES